MNSALTLLHRKEEGVMNKIFYIIVICAVAVMICAGASYAKGSDKTWAGVGKGLAIYEGVKVLTGRQGNIVDDVTGGMQPRQGSQPQQGQGGPGGSYDDGYNDGYREGYQEGYNAGFRHGTEQSAK